MSYSNEVLHEAQEPSGAPATNDPRRMELDVFEKATGSLVEHKDKDSQDEAFRDAVDFNRRLWRALEVDLGSESNKLPDSLKAKLISVAMWVDRHSDLVQRGEAKVDALIDVNQTIMKGLES